MKYFRTIFIYLVLIISSQLHAQSLVEDANLSNSAQFGENLFTETIKIISNSKKIFIITNNNQQLGPGDFISLALDNNLAARAVVAKNHQGQVGIKILKIYSLSQWGRLRRDLEVQIIKGDDTLFGKKTEAPAEQAVSKIKSEDDLYTGDVVVDNEIGTFEDNKKRHIKPDNLVGVSGAFYEASEIPSRGGKVRGTEFGISWAYQFADNYFVEGLYGRTTLNDYPNDGIQTLVNRLTARLKYNFKGPLYTFFMPYVGFQSFTVSSPDAGKGNVTSTIADEEVKAIDDLKKSGPVFGVTVLRRLVPGWFVKADLGTDVISVGFSIEF